MQLSSSLSQLRRHLQPRSRYLMQELQQSQEAQRRHRRSGRGLKITQSHKAQSCEQHDVQSLVSRCLMSRAFLSRSDSYRCSRPA